MNEIDCEVIVENGKHYLLYKGEKLPNQIKSKVVQSVEHINQNKSICVVTIKCYAILRDTKN